MRWIFYIGLFFYSSSLYAQVYTKVKLTDDFSLWSRPYFTDTYTVGSLPKGTEAEIINYEKKSQGYGVEVRITTDPNKGKTGWFYYHLAPERRKITFLDDAGTPYSDISGRENTFMPHFLSQEEKLKTHKKKKTFLPVNNDDITDLDQVLKNIQDGTYIIDTAKDKGGSFIPITRSTLKADGTTSLETFYIPRSYSMMTNYIETLNQRLGMNFGSLCPKIIGPTLPAVATNSNFTKGCEFLGSEPKSWDENLFSQCLDALRTKVGGNNKTLNRKDIFKKMYDLEPEEQEFLGSVLTLYGESRSSTDEEGLIVLKTFENRKKYAQKKCKNANLLDVVLQRYQFSMWNSNDPNWKKAISLKEEEKSPPLEISEGYQLKRMAKLYKQFKSKDFHIASQDVKKLDNISHYRTRAMDKRPSSVPSWGTARDSTATIRVNHKNLGSLNKKSKVDHYFFEDVAWSFKFHPYRQKKQGEGKCY